MNFVSAEGEDYLNHYKFSFAESDVPTYIGYTNGPKGDTSATAGITYTSRGGEDVSIYPLVSVHNYNLNYWVPLAYYASTPVEGTDYDSVYLDTSYDTMWVPLDKDGNPFELAPGHTYKVDISYWQKNAANDTSYNDSGLYVGGGYVAPHLPQEYNYENATVEGFDGAYASRPYGALIEYEKNESVTFIITTEAGTSEIVLSDITLNISSAMYAQDSAKAEMLSAVNNGNVTTLAVDSTYRIDYMVEKVQFFVDGEQMGAPTVNGQVTKVNIKNLSEGEHTAYAVVTYSDGTTVTSDTMSFSVTDEVKPAVLYGDLDDSGDVTTVDLAMMKLYLAGSTQEEKINLVNADMDASGEVNTVDLANLKLFLAGVQALLGPQYNL